MADHAKLARLIIRYMAIEPGDEVSRRRWADDVRSEYPYERPILTATIEVSAIAIIEIEAQR